MNSSSLNCTKISLLIIVLISFFGASSAVLCYHCNSKYDPRCGDPFDPFSLGQVNCSKTEQPEHLPNSEATTCRKTTQKIFGKTRVVRECGFLREENIIDTPKCLQRSGTHEVQVLYCSCTTDFCNGSVKEVPLKSLALFMSAILYVLYSTTL